jgi:hypothetical protein
MCACIMHYMHYIACIMHLHLCTTCLAALPSGEACALEATYGVCVGRTALCVALWIPECIFKPFKRATGHSRFAHALLLCFRIFSRARKHCRPCDNFDMLCLALA